MQFFFSCLLFELNFIGTIQHVVPWAEKRNIALIECPSGGNHYKFHNFSIILTQFQFVTGVNTGGIIETGW